jgi:hypothetical protein
VQESYYISLAHRFYFGAASFMPAFFYQLFFISKGRYLQKRERK